MKRPAILSATFVGPHANRDATATARRARAKPAGQTHQDQGATLQNLGTANPDQRQIHQPGLGSYPAVTLAEARRRALGNKQSIEEGRQPQTREAPTFRQATERVIQLHTAKWKPGGRSGETGRATLGDYVHPLLGDTRVDQITTADIMACLTPMWG